MPLRGSQQGASLRLDDLPAQPLRDIGLEGLLSLALGESATLQQPLELGPFFGVLSGWGPALSGAGDIDPAPPDPLGGQHHGVPSDGAAARAPALRAGPLVPANVQDIGGGASQVRKLGLRPRRPNVGQRFRIEPFRQTCLNILIGIFRADFLLH